MAFTRSSLHQIKDIINQLFNPDTNKLTVDTTYSERNAGEDLVNDVQKIEHRFQYVYLNTPAATSVVKSGAGVLHSLTINTTSNGTITVYDNTAGSGQIIAQIQASALPQTFIYDVAFVTGLTVAAAGTPVNVTVGYR